jgi:predicted nucleotidyltransferase
LRLRRDKSAAAKAKAGQEDASKLHFLFPGDLPSFWTAKGFLADGAFVTNSDFQCRKRDASLKAVKTIQPGLLEKAVERLKSEFQPEQIWLFGSHAWGTPTEDSDVDLMVIVPSSDERPIRRMQRAQRCLRGIGFAKDVLVNTRSEFDRYRHLNASLSHRISEQGRKLYG